MTHHIANPIANSGQFAAEEAVIAMRADPRFAATRELIEKLFAMGYGDRIPPDDRPLLGAFCDEYLTNWLFKAAASDAQYPRFVRNFMPAHRWHGHDVPAARTGGDNPDNCYRLAGIEHGTRYRVTGSLGADRPSTVSFTLTANYGTSMTVQTIESHELQCDADGRFALTIDATPADGRPNHLTTQPNVKLLFVRDSMMDWAHETPLDLRIERIGDAKADPVSLEDMILRGVQHALHDVQLYFWFQNLFSGLAPNKLTAPEAPGGRNGGLTTQASAHVNFQLQPDDAAIVEYEPAGAGYSAFQLTEWLFRSADYQTIQSSRNTSQCSVDRDGRVRLVIARRDPGVANWVDTGDRSHVLAMLRWQKMAPGAKLPRAGLRMTSIKRLKEELPKETSWLSPEQRASQLAARVAAYNRRITE